MLMKREQFGGLENEDIKVGEANRKKGNEDKSAIKKGFLELFHKDIPMVRYSFRRY